MMRGARWTSVLLVLAAVTVAACGWWDDNPRDCAKLIPHDWNVEDVRRENDGWRFTTNETIDGGTGDLWVDASVRTIDYGARYCPE